MNSNAQIKEKDCGKRCSQPQSSRCPRISALSCHAYRDEGNVSHVVLGQGPPFTLPLDPLSLGNLDCLIDFVMWSYVRTVKNYRHSCRGQSCSRWYKKNNMQIWMIMPSQSKATWCSEVLAFILLCILRRRQCMPGGVGGRRAPFQPSPWTVAEGHT